MAVRVLDRTGRPCRGADITFLLDGEAIGGASASTGRASITLPSDIPVQVRASFQDAERMAVAAPGQTELVLRFDSIEAPRLPAAARALAWVLRQPPVRDLAARVGAVLLRQSILGVASLGGSRIPATLSAGPVARCPDGSSGRPCVTCRVRAATVRICA